MTKYYYKGSVTLTLNDHGKTGAVCKIGPIEELVEAESPSDAYAKLMDKYEEMVRTDPAYGPVDTRERPIIEFHGEMTKAINSFERDETNERNG